jgi:hypothetical protein
LLFAKKSLGIKSPFWDEYNNIALNHQLLILDLLQSMRTAVNAYGLDASINVSYSSNDFAHECAVHVFDVLTDNIDIIVGHG